VGFGEDDNRSNENVFKKVEVMFCFGTPFLKMILNESQTIWLFLIIY
jgi:hypothetical protein